MCVCVCVCVCVRVCACACVCVCVCDSSLTLMDSWLVYDKCVLVYVSFDVAHRFIQSKKT